MSPSYVEMPRIVPAGDAAALIPISEEMSLETMGRQHSLARAIEGERIAGVRAVIIGRSSLLIHYDPLIHSFEEIRERVERLVERGVEIVEMDGRLREVPVVYGGRYGPDLPYVARHHQMAEEEVVRLQSSAIHVAVGLGFAPGQPLLMGLPRRLALPRRETPVERVPTGSVLIASQTVVYPMPNPTGWWLIGRTPVKLFDRDADPPTYLQAGDRVRFIPITEEEYLEMGGVKAE